MRAGRGEEGSLCWEGFTTWPNFGFFLVANGSKGIESDFPRNCLTLAKYIQPLPELNWFKKDPEKMVPKMFDRTFIILESAAPYSARFASYSAGFA